ncbi:MAG: prohibitin family protein [Candidatus Bathyarchaeia archaeon]
MERYGFEGPSIKGLGIAIIGLIIIAGGLLVFSVGRLNVGYVAVVVDPLLGTTTTVGDGETSRYYFKTPWASVYKIYVATDSIDMWTEGQQIGDYPTIESLSKDGLKVDVDLTVRWSLSPSNVKSLFTKFPNLDWKDRAIVPVIRESIRNIIVNYSAIETIERRGVIVAKMKEQLSRDLQAEISLSNAIVFKALNIREIVLPTRFVEAIEAKLSAEQLAIAAEFNKTKILVEANATAQSKILEAEGRARSRILISNATREAINTIVSWNSEIKKEDITDLYLYLETLKDISESGKGQMIIVSGGNGKIMLPR